MGTILEVERLSHPCESLKMYFLDCVNYKVSFELDALIL